MKPRMMRPSGGGVWARIEATQKTAHAASTVARIHRFIEVSFLTKAYAPALPVRDAIASRSSAWEESAAISRGSVGSGKEGCGGCRPTSEGAFHLPSPGDPSTSRRIVGNHPYCVTLPTRL